MAASYSYKADTLIGQLFASAKPIETADKVLEAARLRTELGNPPGKPGALGDRLNWECLLSKVPNGRDLHLITRDGDFLADFKEKTANLFLIQEWKRRKNGSIIVHSNIKSFATLVDSAIQFSNDPAKKEAISQLASTGSFYGTHLAVAELMQHLDKLTLTDCEQILQTALDNNQVGGIMGDDDVQAFYQAVRAKLPLFGSDVAEAFDESYSEWVVPF